MTRDMLQSASTHSPQNFAPLVPRLIEVVWTRIACGIREMPKRSQATVVRERTSTGKGVYVVWRTTPLRLVELL